MDDMVSLRHAAALLILAAGLILASTTLAAAQAPTPSPSGSGAPATPGDPGTSTTYGFDGTCDQLHDLLSKLPMVGGFDGDVLSGMCKAGNAATHPGEAADAVRSKAWDSTFGQIVDSMLDGLGQMVGATMTMWARLPNDKLLDSTTLWQRIDSYTRVLQVWMLAISIAVSALRIGIARKHLAAEHAEETFRTLARSVIATWIAGGAILAGARITDRFSEWLLDDTVGPNSGGAAELLVKSYRNSAGLLSPGLVFVVTLVGLLGAISMAALTVIRQAFLVVAVGMFPLTAAASGTAAGRQSFARLGGWIVAFLLFKPVASLIYMIAFVTADQANTESATNAGSADAAARSLIGIVLLCSAVGVLPALVRLVAPGLSVIGSGGSGAVATGIVAGAAAIAVTGGKALMARGGGSAATATAGTGAAPPPGPSGTGAGRPMLPPSPSPRGIGAGPPPGPSGPPPQRPGGPGSHRPRGGTVRSSTPASMGRSVERTGNDTATGTRRPGSEPGWVDPNPHLGNQQIDY
ncbi:hypothetical protein A9X06_19405 [Mycobacterium sp. 852002-51759_SCH5129042]|nr:hypothetical protein A9X06_19405 [Mycobacterium sp. 852002-51759_SCH5129042]